MQSLSRTASSLIDCFVRMGLHRHYKKLDLYKGKYYNHNLLISNDLTNNLLTQFLLRLHLRLYNCSNFHLIRVSVQTIYPIATPVDTSKCRTLDKSYSFDSKEERARRAMKLIEVNLN